MAFTENFSDFINDDTPGYVVAQISGNPVEGIFVNDATQASIGISGFESTLPEFTCKESDLTGVAQGTQVVITGVTYKVAEMYPDGTGITVLQLKK